MEGEDEERWPRSCGSSGLTVFIHTYWAGPILEHMEAPGAKVGDDEGDLECKPTAGPLPAPCPKPWLWTALQGHRVWFTDGRSLGSSGLAVFVKMGKLRLKRGQASGSSDLRLVPQPCELYLPGGSCRVEEQLQTLFFQPGLRWCLPLPPLPTHCSSLVGLRWKPQISSSQPHM